MTRIYTCPKCGNQIEIKRTGRKAKDITFAIVCEALKAGKRNDNRVNFSEAARILSKQVNDKVTPGYVFTKFFREADRRNMKMSALLKELGLYPAK